MLYITQVNSFIDLIEAEMNKRNWDRAELSRRAGVHQSTLSMIYSGDRKPGNKVCRKIAKAFDLPAEELLRAADLLPPSRKFDEQQERADYLFGTLKGQSFKQRALDYLELLHQQEEREGTHVSTTENDEVSKPR